MSWIAELDTHGREFPTCVHVTKTTNTMTHGATYVPIEDGKAVRDENAKLRELVRHMGACIQYLDRSDEDGGCVLCPYQSVEHDCGFESRMLELGIEVDA